MNTRFTTSDLIRRPAHTQLDDMPIHIGDIVYLQPANGPAIRAAVIFNAPIDGMTTYTTEVLPAGAAQKTPAQRIRFRHSTHRGRASPPPARLPESRSFFRGSTMRTTAKPPWDLPTRLAA